MTWTDPHDDAVQDATDRARTIAELGGDPDDISLDDCDEYDDRETPVIAVDVGAMFAEAEVAHAAE